MLQKNKLMMVQNGDRITFDLSIGNNRVVKLTNTLFGKGDFGLINLPNTMIGKIRAKLLVRNWNKAN